MSKIRAIDETSPLRGKVCAGDTVLRINGNEIIDVLDYKYYSYDEHLIIDLRRPDGSEYSVSLDHFYGEDPGLDFETYLMDKPRACSNNCIFCFIDQLPRGMRKTMYFKDDDARLSFLLGNYITLTNLSEREIDRIIALNISPVNVSVHTTDPNLRARMLRNPKAGESIAVMHRFAEAGIKMNCQIVCCPGWNDGDALMRSMTDLAAMFPAVNTVSVVPVGLTKFRDRLTKLEPFTTEKAREVIGMVEAFADKCLKKYGTRIFLCSDEMYIKAGLELPSDEYYEDYTQLENGVGVIRLLETEFLSALKLSDRPDNAVDVSIACGTDAAPYLEKILDNLTRKYDNVKCRVYPVINEFFGEGITVSGLITGRDLINTLKGKELGSKVLISQNMIRRDERDFLDDVTLYDVSAALGVPVIPVESDGFALLDAIILENFEPVEPVVRPESDEYYVYN